MSDSKQTSPGPAAGGRVAVAEPLLVQLLLAQERLQARQTLEALLDFLLVELPERLGLTAAELLLADRDAEIARLLPESCRAQPALRLDADPFDLESLYPGRPRLQLLDYGDERMFHILAGDDDAGGAVLLPLFDGDELVGSYHWGLPAELRGPGEADRRLLHSLGQSLSVAFARIRLQQSEHQFVLLDPTTAVGNQRAFRRALRREIARADPLRDPLSLVLLGVDEQASIAHSYGEAACAAVLKETVQRLGGGLRQTDYLTRIAEDRFAVLLPSCSEPHGHDVAERMCRGVEGIAVDDRRGGALQTTLSLGVATWHPAQLPSEDLERVGRLLQAEGESALAQSVLAGGNRVSIARLGALMV